MKHKYLYKTFIYTVLIVCAVIWILPLGVALIKSFQVEGIKNYIYVLNYEKISYIKVIFNSLFIGIVTSITVTIITSLAAFAFSKMKFAGNRIIFNSILACLAVPVASVTSPLFSLIKNFNLLDNHFGVILPLVAFNAPMMLLMIRNYFDTIPDELLESARMDGAGRFMIWCIFMIPLSIPIIANVLVLTFIYSWNDYLMPLLVMRSPDNYPVTLAAQFFMSSTYQSPVDVARIYAVMVLLALPSVLVYLISQRFLVSGVMSGSVKG